MKIVTMLVTDFALHRSMTEYSSVDKGGGSGYCQIRIGVL